MSDLIARLRTKLRDPVHGGWPNGSANQQEDERLEAANAIEAYASKEKKLLELCEQYDNPVFIRPSGLAARDRKTVKSVVASFRAIIAEEPTPVESGEGNADLYEAVQAPQTKQRGDAGAVAWRTYWLIERGSPAEWLKLEQHPYGYRDAAPNIRLTRDSNEALQFAREVDALRFMEIIYPRDAPLKPGLEYRIEQHADEVLAHPPEHFAGELPEGWVAVPKEATEEMIEFGSLIVSDYVPGSVTTARIAASAYRTMLSAAPKLPAKVTGEWLPIESAPRDGAEILLGQVGIKDVEWGVWSQVGASGVWRTAYGSFKAPTHWMPLPAPPKG